MILEVDNIELYFKDKCLLNGIYLKAEAGKVTGILGHNGCGKSCLLHIIFGDLKSKYKLIRIDNYPIIKPLYQTKLIGLLPQYTCVPSAIRLKTVFKLLKVNWQDFVVLFPAFSIYEHKKAKYLSGGELRVLEVFLLLKGDHKIVLLDEPFSTVAPLYIEKFKALISEEKQHKIIILTDHSYKNVIDVSDEIYLIKNGCSKLIGNVKELEDYNYLTAGKLN
ncbi:ATP-binding cassette domain-containing protein [Lacinutrix undariae]